MPVCQGKIVISAEERILIGQAEQIVRCHMIKAADLNKHLVRGRAFLLLPAADGIERHVQLSGKIDLLVIVVFPYFRQPFSDQVAHLH